jgi:beta-galactosidase/beta-glucuronidase
LIFKEVKAPTFGKRDAGRNVVGYPAKAMAGHVSLVPRFTSHISPSQTPLFIVRPLENTSKMPFTKTPLDKNWQFRQTTSLNDSTASPFLPVSQFPTVAHLDLLHHGLIKDPYIDINEIETLWVNDADWEYRTTFPSPASSSGSRHELYFEGLDTICSIVLNGKVILETRNMHMEHRVDVSKFLAEKEGAENLLELKFKNAPAFAKKEKDRIGYKGNGTDVHFGGPERLFVRKAQYHWGWDWGPAINTSGPCKQYWVFVLMRPDHLQFYLIHSVLLHTLPKEEI